MHDSLLQLIKYTYTYNIISSRMVFKNDLYEMRKSAGFGDDQIKVTKMSGNWRRKTGNRSIRFNARAEGFKDLDSTSFSFI